ncbi:MAG: FxSxx-COOH system tetratricopeptide repeat protein, partial [Anaerolineae bacterium]
MMTEQEQLTQLRHLIAAYFNEAELRSLCFDLGKPYDQLAGGETVSKTRELIAWSERHDRLPDLYALLKEQRPRVDWGLPPASSRAAAAPVFPLHSLPFPRNPSFTGRADLLAYLQQNLSAGAGTAVPLVIAGLGGVGKTQLALEYAYRYQDDYDLIWWLSAEDTMALGAGFSRLAGALGLANAAAREQDVLVNLVLRWLTQTGQSTLLIFDNADTLDPARIQPYWPKGGPSHLLITSQNPNWGGVANVLRLDIFQDEEAVAFLQQRSPRAAADEARMLAQALGYFPLALAHAAAYAETTGCTLADYRELYAGRRQALWQRAQPPSSYHATISTTWDLAFQKVRQSQPAALDLLNLCCFLAADDIPLSMLRTQADHLPGELAAAVGDFLALDDAIAALRRYSMMGREGDGLNLHRLVQAVTRDRMEEAERRQWLETAVALLAAAWPFQDHDQDTWEPGKRLLPHLLAVAEHARQYPLETAAAATIHYQAGLYLHLHGDLAGARPYYEWALAVRETVLGADRLETAQALNKLGHLLSDTGEIEQARVHLERALAIREAALGPEHPDVADSLDLLGNLLGNAGDDEGARPYLERALAIRENTLGPQHPETGQSLNDLGVVLN